MIWAAFLDVIAITDTITTSYLSTPLFSHISRYTVSAMLFTIELKKGLFSFFFFFVDETVRKKEDADKLSIDFGMDFGLQHSKCDNIDRCPV